MTSAPIPKARIAFVFTKGRRLRRDSESETPSELFYGYAELARWGWDVELLEERDLATAHRSVAGRAASKVLPLVVDASLPRVAAIGLGTALARLNRYDAIVVTNQQLGIELSTFAALGLLRPPLLVIVMGLLPLEPKGASRAFALRHVLRRSTVMAISRSEQSNIHRRLGPALDVRYMPFGVDHRFWRPEHQGSGGYVLSVGNDQHRDFALLAKVWRSEWPPLRIISRLQIPPSAANVEVVKGDYVNHVITDVEMRRHVQGALFSVIPLRATWQPSGQSAALQSMACGVPLVLSDTPGLWDRDVMRDGTTCLLPPAGSADDLTAAIERMLASEALRSRLGAAARTAVEQHFTADLMAGELGKVLRERVHEAA